MPSGWRTGLISHPTTGSWSLKAFRRSQQPGKSRLSVHCRIYLLVSLPRNSRVVPISFDSHSPAVAAMVANAYAENLIAGNLQRHYDTSSYSKEFLQIS